MDTNELKEYLNMVADLEKNLYLQNETINKMEIELNDLSQKMPQKISAPAKPIKSDINFEFGKVWIITIIVSIVSILFFEELGILFALIAILIAAFIHYQKNSDNENKYENAMMNYKASLREYKKSEQERLEITDAIEIQKNIFIAEIDKLNEQKVATKNTLQKLYDYNIIFPKYRNLVMICSLCEYLSAGRCDTLEGHEGAYNILETEIRLDKIIVKFDHVLKELNTIANNQYTLYTAIQESNQQIYTLFDKTTSMVNDVLKTGRNLEQQSKILNSKFDDMTKISAITAYSAERSRKELHYLNRMNYLTGKNDGVLFNTPPSN